MACTTEVREQHKALCEDLVPLDAVEHADAFSPSTSRGAQWTTEIVLAPGVDVVPSDVLALLDDHDMGIAPPVLDRGQPPQIAVQVQRDVSRWSE